MSRSKKTYFWEKRISRRGFLKGTLVGGCLSLLSPFTHLRKVAANPLNSLYWVKNIPVQPFYSGGNGNYHAGVENLLSLMGNNGLKFYRSAMETLLSGPSGMIESNDIVLIKVNAQWKYRGSTNSDLIRGLIQRILDHPDGFNGEVVIFENGQSQGSLNGDALGWGSYPDNSVHANANNESHSFLYLINSVFNDPRVSGFLLDPIRSNFIGASDHSTNGYRLYENVSYPCFTTSGGYRVELREGVWNGSGYSQNLKLINVPVLKIHAGSEITASLKHFYGVVSMSDGQSPFRHYVGLGETSGKMVVSVRTPLMNIIDAIWVSHGSLSGYPANTTFRANQILASQDPVALDYWATKYILYPKTNRPQHLPTYSAIDQWLTAARDMINGRGGLYNPNAGIMVADVTKNEQEMAARLFRFSPDLADYDGDGMTDVSGFHLPSESFFVESMGNLGQYGWGTTDSMPLIWDYNRSGKTGVSFYHIPTNQWFVKGVPGDSLGQYGWGLGDSVPVPGDYDGDGIMEKAFYHSPSNIWFIEGQDPIHFGWGGADSIPIAADYDGDGKTDMMLYHMPTNQWFVYGVGNLGQFGWNGSECIPVPGDWDGDGKTEIGIYHVPTNQWFWRDQDGTDYFLGQYGWGGLQSFPIPGDYNGDGIMERAFYRPSENRWFIEGEADFVWGWDTSNFMPITSQMAIYNWFRFVLGMFQ